MESSYWLLIADIFLLFATDVSCVKKSKLEAKVDALDFIVRGELYLLKETIETDRQERKELVKKLNETLEVLETARGDRVDKKHVDTNNDWIKKELNSLSEKTEQISQLAETYLRTKRGLMEEKRARKADAAAVVAELIQIERTLNDLSNTQQDIIKNQNEIIKNQNKIVNNVTDMRNEIITIQTDQVDNFNVIATKTDALQNTTADLRDKTDMFEHMLEQTLKTELSKYTKMKNNTTQELVLWVSDIAQATEEVKAAVAPKLYCNNQLDLDACLQKQLKSTVQQILGTVRLAGGRNGYEGRVEIDYQQRHGTVCDDDWDNRDAKVVCRMLGFTGGTAFQGRGHSFGTGTGEILLDNVDCTGDELSLFACKHNGIGVENCGHHEDAGIRCDP